MSTLHLSHSLRDNESRTLVRRREVALPACRNVHRRKGSSRIDKDEHHVQKAVMPQDYLPGPPAGRDNSMMFVHRSGQRNGTSCVGSVDRISADR